MHKYLDLTYSLKRKIRNIPFIKFLDSQILKQIFWITAAIVVVYRLLMGEWFILLVCSAGAVLLVLLKQHWKSISKAHRQQLLFSLITILFWCFLTMHSPAYALFFDTLEKGLTTLFSRFGVTGIQKIPLWIGGVFRILGIVFLAILALRFGRSREDDDEAARPIISKLIQVVAGLLVFDSLIELFTT